MSLLSKKVIEINFNGPVRSFFDYNLDSRNRCELLTDLGLQTDLIVIPKQIHSTNIQYVSQPCQINDADGLITMERGIILSIIVAERIAKKAQEKKITKIYFDRGNYKFHGRVKTFADTLRKNGMEF